MLVPGMFSLSLASVRKEQLHQLDELTAHIACTRLAANVEALLLCAAQRGGRTTYFGPLGDESSQLISYLQSVPGETEVLYNKQCMPYRTFGHHVQLCTGASSAPVAV